MVRVTRSQKEHEWQPDIIVDNNSKQSHLLQ